MSDSSRGRASRPISRVPGRPAKCSARRGSSGPPQQQLGAGVGGVHRRPGGGQPGEVLRAGSPPPAWSTQRSGSPRRRRSAASGGRALKHAGSVPRPITSTSARPDQRLSASAENREGQMIAAAWRTAARAEAEQAAFVVKDQRGRGHRRSAPRAPERAGGAGRGGARDRSGGRASARRSAGPARASLRPGRRAPARSRKPCPAGRTIGKSRDAPGRVELRQGLHEGRVGVGLAHRISVVLVGHRDRRCAPHVPARALVTASALTMAARGRTAPYHTDFRLGPLGARRVDRRRAPGERLSRLDPGQASPRSDRFATLGPRLRGSDGCPDPRQDSMDRHPRCGGSGNGARDRMREISSAPPSRAADAPATPAGCRYPRSSCSRPTGAPRA